jgi:hypothetical protein
MVRLENYDRRQRASSHDRRTLLGERGHCVLGCSVMSSIGLPGAARRTQPATRLMIVLYSKATIGDNGRTGKWFLTVRTALERWVVPASMFVSPRVVPAGGWVVPASVSTTAWTQYQVTWAIDPAGHSLGRAYRWRVVKVYESTGNSGSTQDQDGRSWAGPTRIQLDSADLGPGRPGTQRLRRPHYQTSNQNLGQSQRYTTLQMYVASTPFYTKKTGSIRRP